jgi:hypothetical protein
MDIKRIKTSKDIIYTLPLPDGVHALATVYDSHQIWKVNLQTGEMVVWCGSVEGGYLNAKGHQAQFNNPYGPAMKSDGSVLVADKCNNVIREISHCGSYVVTLAGVHTEEGGYENGHVLSAKFKHPYSICVGPDDSIYVVDDLNYCIRKISGDEVSTVAGRQSCGYLNGAGNEAQFRYLYDIDIDDDGNL